MYIKIHVFSKLIQMAQMWLNLYDCQVVLNRASLTVSPKMEATQMEIFNFLWLTWDH